MPSKSVTKKKSVNLALQGGGAHGAFTWGVLDRIFEDGRLEVEAISSYLLSSPVVRGRISAVADSNRRHRWLHSDGDI